MRTQCVHLCNKCEKPLKIRGQEEGRTIDNLGRTRTKLWFDPCVCVTKALKPGQVAVDTKVDFDGTCALVCPAYLVCKLIRNGKPGDPRCPQYKGE